jgi:hypothetical protein
MELLNNTRNKPGEKQIVGKKKAPNAQQEVAREEDCPKAAHIQ